MSMGSHGRPVGPIGLPSPTGNVQDTGNVITLNNQSTNKQTGSGGSLHQLAYLGCFSDQTSPDHHPGDPNSSLTSGCSGRTGARGFLIHCLCQISTKKQTNNRLKAYGNRKNHFKSVHRCSLGRAWGPSWPQDAPKAQKASKNEFADPPERASRESKSMRKSIRRPSKL
jgi:hypothetical protein